MNGPRAKPYYRISKLIGAVLLSGEKIGSVAELPAGSVVNVLGASRVPSLIEVECNGEHYGLFQEDLLYRAQKVRKASK